MTYFVGWLFPLLAFALPLAATEVVLIQVPDQLELEVMQTSDAALSLTENEAGPVLQMTLGQTERWPGVTFTLDHGADVSTHGELVFQIKNTGESSAKIHCRIDSQPAGSEASETLTRTHPISLKPGVMREVRIPLVPYVHYEGISPEDFFGMRGIPFFSNESMHLENITQLIFFVIQDNTPHSFELGPIRLAGEPAPPSTTAVPEQVFPFIDQFGQFKHKDWPGKTHSLEAMIQAGVDEAAQLAEAAPPSSWNRYGGWKDGPQLEATGWFRTAKHDGKWTLVDPEGRLFFSVGIDGVAFKLGTIVDERQHWFDHLPEDNAENSELYFSWTPNLKRSHFYNKSVRAFSFHKFNAMRKYGDDWENRFAEMCTQRLPAWGVNTLGNWSSPDIYLRGKLPYVAYVRPDSKPLAGSSGHWGKFKDVLDPSFEASIRRKLSEPRLVETIEDPMCIGYFVDNELTFGDETAMAVAALQSPVDQSAKWVFLSDLKQKYGTIDALNTAWQTNYASWAAMLEATHAPEGDGAHADLVAFNTKFVRTYFSTIHRVLEEVAPNHMYLGCRYGSNAQITPVVLEANAEFADVVSFNVYSRHLADKLAGLERTGDKPYIIGEFHFGALDRGMFDTGLVKVADQDERADAYYQYVMDCVNHPNIVGCHWFQFCDSPTTGRLWDHENYQIGFTDTCDTPYAELIEASRRAGEDLYE